MRISRKAIAKATMIAAMLTSPLLLAGCGGGNTPTGQVIATVDGKEITKRDLVAEFQAANMQPSEDPKTRSAMLERIIQRKLLAAKAVDDKLDKTPDYLASVERARDATLAGLLSKRLLAIAPTHSDEDARKFVTDNPQMFANRNLLLVNQVQAAGKGINPKSLEQYTTLDQITALFSQQKRKFERRQTVVDTANLPSDMAAKILALAPEDLFIVSPGDGVVVSAIIKREPQPVPEGKRLEAAKQLLQRMEAERAIKAELDTLQRRAKIEYQPDYTPPKTGA